MGNSKCCVCTKNLNKLEKNTCAFCVRRVKSSLISIENSYLLLPDEILNRGSASLAGRVTGSKESAIPGGDALVFTTTGRIWVKDAFVSEDDPLPVISTLCYYEDEWRKLLQANPGQRKDISSVVSFLAESIVWAAREYSRFAEFFRVIQKINGHLDSIVRNSERKLRANAPCFKCGGKLSKEYKKSRKCTHFPRVEIEANANSEGWIGYGIDFAVKTGTETIIVDKDENTRVYYLENWEPCGCDQGGLRFFWECDKCGQMYSDEEYYEEIRNKLERGKNMQFKKSSYCGTQGNCVEVAFFKSSFSIGQGACVEVAVHSHIPEDEDPKVVVRHSKNHAHVIAFTYEEWDAFIKGVKDGEFDHTTTEEIDA